ncbi:hypothetical protein [Paraburkholderia sp. DHOC27]|uniref:hypothetical protein n=1 Tax=Paraburkholderia sp. DHOC27 TaxID=2303330 RepID=UPI000E3DA246|nr:hypothetical protein [Paraburkholderia sp. DHOC27]RFU47907.1 hypothetical protein D0B32_10260 [Paraburkholderia sp. DHOC27]
MGSGSRRIFERLVCVGVLALPLLAFLAARNPDGVRTGIAGIAGVAATAAPVASARAAPVPDSSVTATAPTPVRTPAADHAPLVYRTSWVGNTWGYAQQRWVQIDVQALAVTPEGDVFTNAPWDEGGGEIGHYRDGQLLGYAGLSHGWGLGGGDAIAVNNDYVFVAQAVESLGNQVAALKHMPPEGVLWYGVTRRSRADFRESIPFDGQMDWPNTPLSFLRIAQSPTSQDLAIRGLAADATHLFVSNMADNRIDIFDARSMQRTGGFAVREPGKLAVAPDGTLWIIERSRTDSQRRVTHHALSGALLGSLRLPPGTIPVDLTLDTQGRLLIADNSARQQILIFSAPAAGFAGSAGSAQPGSSSQVANDKDNSMQLSGTLGEAGGIYAGRAGAVGPLRFNGLTGVGVDRAGNVYVSMNGAGPRGFDGGPCNCDGTLIESYTPAGQRRFSLQALLFVDGAQFADGEPPSVYSGTKRFAMDLSRGAGEEWSYAGFTADRFRYPYDPLFNLKQGQRGTPLVRDVDGHRLLYTIDQTSMYLRIYRFAADRETAIPSGLIVPVHVDGAWPPNQPAHGEWIWRDTAGHGRFAPGDFDQSATGADAPPMSGYWVDSKGDVWWASQEQGIRRFPLQGFDRTGNPVYTHASMRSYPMPEGFERIARVNYFPASDTMFISGSTHERPFVGYNWNGMGSTLARYDHWSSGKPELRYKIDLPDRAPPAPASLNGFAVAGDYIFAVETHTAFVRVFDRGTGDEVGLLKPGPEVGETSGWADVSMPVTAHRLATGEYLVFVEEDAHGKALMYRFMPPARPLAQASSSIH